METVVALLGLSGLGYLVTKATDNQQQQQQKKEGFTTSQTRARSDIPRGPPGSPLVENEKGAVAKGFGPELDMMYKTPGGHRYPSEPNPESMQGLPYMFASEKGQAGGPEGVPVASRANFAAIQLNSAGYEAGTGLGGSGVGGGFVKSDLTGETIPADKFTHANMVPFFGGRMKQNVDSGANTSRLDMFTGAGTTQISKKEIEPMFDYMNTPFGNPFGMEDNTDFVQSRIELPRNRKGERPFEPTRVAPAVGEGYGITGKGGFQQLEVNEYMMKNIKRTDDLRVADKPKLSYEGVAVPGAHFIGKASEEPGEVRKYRPDRFYVDETGERFFVTNGEIVKETARSIQVMRDVTRPETSVEYTGIAGQAEGGDSYVSGTYRTPMTQQYAGTPYRNANMTEYYTPYVDSPEADYGKKSIEIRPNERYFTGERVMGLNLVPAEAGATTVHYVDPSRPTRRSEIIGNIRQTGTAVGYAGGAPSITVWDPEDVARTTVKEGTVEWNRFGIAASGSGPNKLKVYDPDDIARPTQKAQLSQREYFGSAGSYAQDLTSHVAAYNMRTNPNKEQIAKGRKPVAGNGNVAIFTGEINQRSKKINADYINDRVPAVNRVEGLPPGAGDLGDVRFRVPLKLDVSMERNQREMIGAVQNNPLMATQSLHRNANLDATSPIIQNGSLNPERDDDMVRRMMMGIGPVQKVA